jgi:LysR family glycine cleavage system transcriptional activator
MLWEVSMPDLPVLPPLPALRAFHAAARFGRFRDAASALGITESAISHQVRKLEDWLSVRLFERSGPRIRLTPDGERYYAAIDPAFGEIRAATEALRAPAGRNRVSLTLPASLATYWLIPRLDGLEKTCPGIDLELVTTSRLIDLKREGVDLAIRYGGGQWPDVTVRCLMGEQLVPVARPGFVAAVEARDPAGTIAAKRLIMHTGYPQQWIEWSTANGHPPPVLTGALRFSSTEQILAAAAQGLGLAIGARPMVDQMLEARTLVAPFGGPGRDSEACYWLAWPKDQKPTVAAGKVARWLETQASRAIESGFAAPATAEPTKRPRRKSRAGQSG